MTGHRFLAEIDTLDSGLDHVIHRLEKAFPEDWTVVSALAEGADRLVAHRLLARRGTRLFAVLPLPADDYAHDFQSTASAAEFHELLSLAHQVVQVPPQPNRERAYEAAGNLVLTLSKVLIAVWDGQVAQGPGGTGGIVAQARERGLPLAWIHAGNRKPASEESTSLGREQGHITFERFPYQLPLSQLGTAMPSE